MGVGEAAGRMRFALGGGALNLTAGQQLAAGRSAGERWSSGVSRGTVTWTEPGLSLVVDGLAGHVTPGTTPAGGSAFEQFAAGGSASPFADVAFSPSRIPLPAVPLGYAAGQRIALVRASLGGQVVEPGVTWLAAGDSRTAWRRVVSVERELTFPSLGYARLPSVRVRGGVGYALDAPREHRVRAFVTLRYRP